MFLTTVTVRSIVSDYFTDRNLVSNCLELQNSIQETFYSVRGLLYEL